MLGDLIILTKKLFKRHLICRHDYVIVHRKDMQGGSFLKCCKCDKLK